MVRAPTDIINAKSQSDALTFYINACESLWRSLDMWHDLQEFHWIVVSTNILERRMKSFKERPEMLEEDAQSQCGRNEACI